MFAWVIMVFFWSFIGHIFVIFGLLGIIFWCFFWSYWGHFRSSWVNLGSYFIDFGLLGVILDNFRIICGIIWVTRIFWRYAACAKDWLWAFVP